MFSGIGVGGKCLANDPGRITFFGIHGLRFFDRLLALTRFEAGVQLPASVLVVIDFETIVGHGSIAPEAM